MAYSNRRKSDGALLITDKPMSLRESIAWCGLFAMIVGGGIGLSLYFTGA